MKQVMNNTKSSYRSECFYELSIVDCSAVIPIKYIEDSVQLCLVGGKLRIQHARYKIISVDCTILDETVDTANNKIW